MSTSPTPDEKKDEGLTSTSPNALPLNQAIMNLQIDDIPQDVMQSHTASQTSAFQLLEQYFEADMMTIENMLYYKEKFTKLNNYVLDLYRHERSLLKQAKTLNSDLLSEKINVEKYAIRKEEELAAYTNAEKEKEKALKELTDTVDRDAIFTFELTELQHEHVDLINQKNEILQAHARLIEPEVQKLTQETTELREELESVSSDLNKEEIRKTDLSSRLETLKQEKKNLESQYHSAQKQFANLQSDPDRMEKQADVVDQAVRNMEIEVSKLREKLKEVQLIVTEQTQKMNATDEIQKELNHKLDTHRDTIDQRQRDLDHVTIHLREEQNIHVARLSEKVRLELTAKAFEATERRESEKLHAIQKYYDVLKRTLKKKILQHDASKALLPNLKSQVIDAKHQVSAIKASNQKTIQAQNEMKEQLDVLIARFLKQETGEKQQTQEMNKMQSVVSNLEKDLSQWIEEEGKQKQLITMLIAQRELKAREASTALESEKSTQQELKMKEIMIFDLAKKWHETNNHLHEFSALYDVVKNERNKYVNLIQASSQALAEMKEKIKILQNEVEVLRNESMAKDKALSKEKLAHTTAQCTRDSLRLDANKNHDLYRLKQETVEQQIVEIEKLNGNINSTEKEMIRNKKKYEQAIEGRNLAGVQLIERNDELCLLYDKSNVLEKTLQDGELQLSKTVQDLRMLQIQLNDLQRQAENARKHLPVLPKYAEQILLQQHELGREKEVTDLLCRELETPSNEARWRELQGDDPDEEQLRNKIETLEARYYKKKEHILEKDLVLEEVTSLSNKLRTQAMEQRNETLAIAQQVNDFQARIKDTTRKMMAIVSELSMYQATAMKLQQEKHLSNVELESYRVNIARNMPPCSEAEQQLVRMQTRIMKAETQKFLKAQQEAAAQHRANFPSQVKYTTAESRPNAYIPAALGIPKPYGASAPFKPTVPGSTMRHIRNPQLQDIEI